MTSITESNLERASGTTHAVQRFAATALCLLPLLALAWLAWVHVLDGLANEAAIPVPVYMIAGISMPKAAYNDAVQALAAADMRDGEARIARGEAATFGGAQSALVTDELMTGLTAAPASARGWLLLSERWHSEKKEQAVAALSQSLLLARNDYWLIGRCVQDAAELWPRLDADTRRIALEQTRLLWAVPTLRSQFLALLTTRSGAAIVTQAFANDQDEIRKINRWLVVQRRLSAAERQDG